MHTSFTSLLFVSELVVNVFVFDEAVVNTSHDMLHLYVSFGNTTFLFTSIYELHQERHTLFSHRITFAVTQSLHTKTP